MTSSLLWLQFWKFFSTIFFAILQSMNVPNFMSKSFSYLDLCRAGGRHDETKNTPGHIVLSDYRKLNCKYCAFKSSYPTSCAKHYDIKFVLTQFLLLHKKWSFPLRISSLNMTNNGPIIVNGKLIFLCSGLLKYTSMPLSKSESRMLLRLWK